MSSDLFRPGKGGEPLETERLCLLALAVSVPFVRRTVAKCLSAWGLDDLVLPCTQVVTELAANSVAAADAERTSKPHERATGTFTVHLSRTSTHLLIEVGDASSALPKPRTATEQDENGRGLVLIEALADRWGWYPNDLEGKVVYAAWNLPGIPTAARPAEARQ
ncbi:ATP-binding protein [Actinocorallia populi]|uniref:ATP-binding protein n=1 Tax=Actinocorallia populi TaxID=2079200 RepID=UPI000D08929A|nr:ATP-binding protein [Actinocorallia populi]